MEHAVYMEDLREVEVAGCLCQWVVLSKSPKRRARRLTAERDRSGTHLFLSTMSTSRICSLSSRSQSRILHQSLRARGYATYTELPRPPPSKLPESVTYSGTSKPREYYTRPQPRELPPLQVIRPFPLHITVVRLIFDPFEAKMASHPRSQCFGFCCLGRVLCVRSKSGEVL